MRKKLIVLFTLLTVCLCALIGRLMYINYTSGEKYEKKVLSMQSYDSVTIPYQRGDIVDRNGTVLATSVAVYNVIMDCSVMTSESKVDGEKVQKYLEPTIEALVDCFPELDKATLYKYAEERPDSKYIILLKKLPYDQIQPFVQLQEEVDDKGKKVNPNIKGVWFEKVYQRRYPFNSMASSVLGFVSAGDVGTIGLENYYNDILNGINGREYGYLNSESDFEKTVIAPQDGSTLVTTIDANIQSIVEKKILEFNAAYTNNYREGDGSLNTAVIIMNPNTGAILAMADYPNFDLNNPRDVSKLFTEEELETVTTEDQMNALNQLWRNFCVSETYEPGSVQKPFTVAGGLETGALNTNLTFVCDGHETISGSFIGCVALQGHGTETLEKSLMDSCNDALMQMATNYIGVKNFTEYQGIFGFGQKTGIDLPGEAYTASLIYTEENMTTIDLATNSFGQNYNCTMIQMVSAFSSLVNGGYYYQPYLVSKVVGADGGTVSVTEPTVLKQTVSQGTSDLLRTYMYNTVSHGTGNTAKVDGYSMGGKTGTAEKLPRNQGNYLVSYMGFAPYENPELVIYCIVDEPNTIDQPHSYYAQNLAREIMEEIFPYMNIYPDEELTGVNANLDITGIDPYFNGERDGDYLPGVE
ncbi:MAG: peptidoglycan glycosyltransferase [Agathobacter sp.]|nr:peptidoglycan glycosyltransferase [Agathobacter sp.]